MELMIKINEPPGGGSSKGKNLGTFDLTIKEMPIRELPNIYVISNLVTDAVTGKMNLENSTSLTSEEVRKIITST